MTDIPGVVVVRDGHELGELLRARRQMLGRTLAGIQARTGIRLSEVSCYELGKTSPTAVRLARLAPGYGYDLALIPREKA